MLVEKIKEGDMNIVFVYTTCHDWEEARSIGLSAIEKKLAVCSDFWEINSVYPWHGVIQEVGQYMLMLTTEKRLSTELTAFIGTIHSYTTPMIAELDTALMNSAYKFWVDNTLRNPEDYIGEEDAKILKESEENNGYHFGKLK